MRDTDMTYRAPINDMLLALNHGAGLQAAVKAGHYGDFDADITAAVAYGPDDTYRLAPPGNPRSSKQRLRFMVLRCWCYDRSNGSIVTRNASCRQGADKAQPMNV